MDTTSIGVLIAVFIVGSAVGIGAHAYSTSQYAAEAYQPEFPLTTGEQAWEYAQSLFYGANITCPAGTDNYFTGETTGALPYNQNTGKYGNPLINPDGTTTGHLIDYECGETFQAYYIIRFDPNNGRPWYRKCISAYIDDCPPDIKDFT